MISLPRVMGAGGSHRLLLVLQTAAAAPEPRAAAQVRPVSILLEELLVLRDQVVVDRLPNQALRDEERVQLLLVERAQVDGVLLVAVALYRQRGRPAADPGDGHALVARRAKRRSEEALHLRQAIELSAGAGDDVGRHLLRVCSGEEYECCNVGMHSFAAWSLHCKQSARRCSKPSK